ncbi:hypothetical protein EOM86_08730 [Candidatus Nomurabacteria bacterium]|nr:hypothetical protein [Candidatus Nomurabacteria bacterium]
MIKVLVGLKGSGKTAKLVDDMNRQAADNTRIIVCIQRGTRLDTQLKPQIRLIDMNDYPTQGYDGLLDFIAGICSKDYDLTDIYIDSIRKVTKVDDEEQFQGFLERLEPFAESQNIDITIIYSADPSQLPDGIRKYCSEY